MHQRTYNATASSRGVSTVLLCCSEEERRAEKGASCWLMYLDISRPTYVQAFVSSRIIRGELSNGCDQASEWADVSWEGSDRSSWGWWWVMDDSSAASNAMSRVRACTRWIRPRPALPLLQLIASRINCKCVSGRSIKLGNRKGIPELSAGRLAADNPIKIISRELIVKLRGRIGINCQ